MLDLALIALTIAFFILTFGLIHFFDFLSRGE